MIFHRFCSLVLFSLSLSLYPPRYDMDQLLIPIFFFFIGSIDCRSNDHIPTDRSDTFFRYRISAHIKTIAYFPLQRWLNLPAFPTNERTTSPDAGDSQIPCAFLKFTGEKGYILCRMVGDRHRITVIERRIVQRQV